MQPFETIYVDTTVVACNGGGGPLGHPKVYLSLAAEGKVDCPYCSRVFVRRPHPHEEGHGVEVPQSAAASQSVQTKP
jgi:uncharacterized Zn-finger protein